MLNKKAQQMAIAIAAGVSFLETHKMLDDVLSEVKKHPHVSLLVIGLIMLMLLQKNPEK